MGMENNYLSYFINVNDGKLKSNHLTSDSRPMLMLNWLNFQIYMHKIPLQMENKCWKDMFYHFIHAT